MTRNDIKQKIIERIKADEAITYVELERIFESCGFDYKGEYVICSEKCDAIVFWVNWNESAIHLINEMKVAGEIHQELTHVFTYLLDGKTPNIPVMKQARDYKTERWLPLVFKLG